LTRVAIVGLGYVGLTLAVALARRGVDVVGYDRAPSVVAALQAGRAHLYEPGIADELGALLGDRLRVVSTLPSEPVDAAVLCVSTPVDPTTRAPVLEPLRAAARSVAHVIGRSARLARDDHERDDAHVGGLEAADHIQQGANAVLQEDIELAHARPITSSSRRIADGRPFIAVTHVWDSLLANMQYTKIYRQRSNDKLNSGFEFADFRLRAPDLKKTLRSDT